MYSMDCRIIFFAERFCLVLQKTVIDRSAGLSCPLSQYIQLLINFADIFCSDGAIMLMKI